MRRAALNLLLSLFAAGLTLAVLEAGARLVRGREGGGKQRNERRQYVDWDPVLGWKKRPGARVTYQRREYTTEVVINSHGLRDPERGPEAAPGTARILALGDSFVEAYSVPLEASVTQRLEGRLRAGGCRVDVINGGTGGYSTDQEYLFYRQEGARYGPSVVLAFLNVTDVVYNAFPAYFNMPKPAFAVTPRKGLHPRNLPLPPWPPAKAAREPGRPAKPSGSALLALVRERLMRGAPQAYQSLARLGFWPPLEPEAPPREMRVYKSRAPVEIEDGWFITSELLAALRADVEADGGHLVLVYVPGYFEINDRAWELLRLQHGLAEDKFERALPARRLAALAAERGIAFLDLREALRRDEGWRGRTYHPRDGHWNERGHAAVASELEAFLRARGWVPGCPG